MELELSWAVVLKICVAGLATYVILPFCLVIRDSLILKAIEKYVITPELHMYLRMYASDRWLLENKYNKDTLSDFSVEPPVFKIHGQAVSKDKLDDYKNNHKFHEDRLYGVSAKLKLRSNLIIWLTKHYKLDELKNPIPELQKKYCESFEKEQERKA
jgi:hypothetical protein